MDTVRVFVHRLTVTGAVTDSGGQYRQPLKYNVPLTGRDFCDSGITPR